MLEGVIGKVKKRYSKTGPTGIHIPGFDRHIPFSEFKQDFKEEKKELENFYKDETGKSFNPENLPNISLENIKDKAKFLFLALAFISSSPEKAFAQNTNDSKSLEWLLQAVEKIDPIEYLANRNIQPESRKENTKFTESEKNILAWNLYFEARGENVSGQLGVLLSVFERMKSNKYPATAEAVVMQNYQYSWTLKILENNTGKKDEKVDIKKFLELRKLVEQYTQGKSISKNIESVRKEIMKLENLEGMPENLTHYHLEGMLSLPNFANLASPKTKERIQKIEGEYKNKNSKIIKLGRHLFYPGNIF